MAESKRSRAAKTDSLPPLPTSKMVQTRVPLALYKRIENCARGEMISVAAYVRRALMNVVPGG